MRLYGQQSLNDNLIVTVSDGVVAWIYAFSTHGVACGD